MKKKTYIKFVDLIYKNAGIQLGPQKEALLSSRISKRMRLLNIKEPADYYDYIIDNHQSEMEVLLNAISTNTTHFFREYRHFELLTSILNEWQEKGQRRFRLWSAASSTGEEPYSIAITLMETLKNKCDAKLLATDISTKVLHKAVKGVYQAQAVRDVPPAIMKAYFTKSIDKDQPIYHVSSSAKKLVKFGRLNLATPPYPITGPLDLIFCRNVMIYFDTTGRKKFIEEAYRLLKPDGYLFVGHSESLSGIIGKFHMVQPSVYQK